MHALSHGHLMACMVHASNRIATGGCMSLTTWAMQYMILRRSVYGTFSSRFRIPVDGHATICNTCGGCIFLHHCMRYLAVTVRQAPASPVSGPPCCPATIFSYLRFSKSTSFVFFSISSALRFKSTCTCQARTTTSNSTVYIA